MNTKQKSHDLQSSLPENLRPLAREITTYLQELPRLVSEKKAGLFVVIQGVKVFGTWDNYPDASRYAHETFGMNRPYLIHKIDERDPDHFAAYVRSIETACPS